MMSATEKAAALSGWQRHDTGNFITSDTLAGFPWLIHGCSTRDFSHPHAERGEELRRFQNTLGVSPLPIIHADQRHTSTVGVVDEQTLAAARDGGRFYFPKSDAIVCPLPNVSIAIFTADCAPVFIIDTRTRAIALAHAGWQGTLQRIAQRTVDAMGAGGCDARDLVAWIGPTAGGCCYEVSEELAERFSAEFTDTADGDVLFRNGRMLNIAALNSFQLRRAGLAPANVFQGGLCTMHQRELFYSYRADGGTTGRIISMMTAVA